MAHRVSHRGQAGLLFLLLWLFPCGAHPAPSSLDPTMSGAKVLYLFLADLGYHTTRAFSVDDIDPQTDLVVALDLSLGPQQKALLDWIGEGRLGLFAPPRAAEGTPCDNVKVGELTFTRRLAAESSTKKNHHELNIHNTSCVLDLPREATLLAGTPEAALAFEQPYGDGGLLVLAHHEMVLNADLDDDDIAVLIRRWIYDNIKENGAITFLEDSQGTDLLKLLRQTHLGPLLLLGIGWLILLYWSLIYPFGDAFPLVTATRRAFAQHAQALGRLYQRRGASAHILRQQYERFLLRFFGGGESRHGSSLTRRTSGLSQPTYNRATMVSWIATRSGREPAVIESILTQIEYTIAGADSADPRDVQRHFHLSQSLAALLHSSTTHSSGGQRGPKPVRREH